jgi:hypothetical protein
MADVPDHTEHAVRGSRRARRPPRRRWRRRLIGLTLLVLIGGTGFGLVWMLTARTSLVEGRRAMLVGRDHLLGGDTTAALASFTRARTAFEDARGSLGNPFVRLAAAMPVVGRTPDAVIAVADAGSLVAGAAERLAGAAQNLPGGLASLAPLNGVVDIEPFRQVAPAVSDARDLMVQADQTLLAAPTDLVPEPVAGPLEDFGREVTDARQALVTADAVVQVLPSFLGEDGRRRYFFGAQNPAELRGTGGLIGSYAILTIDRGRLEFGPFQDILGLPVANPDLIEPPNPDYGNLYGPAAAHGDWSNINMTPDFPSAALAIERLYELVRGERLDGTVLADPAAFATLLGVTGPAEVSRLGTTVDQSNVVAFVTNEAYSVLPAGTARKDVLSEVAGEVIDYFLGSGAASNPAGAGLAVVQAAGEGHLLFHAADPGLQTAFVEAGVSGELPDPSGDLLEVSVVNAGGNKIDFYAERRVRYEVWLEPDGSATGRTTITFRNGAPDRGQPPYVIGPNPRLPEALPGDNIMNVYTYCATTCTVGGVTRNGEPTDAVVAQELGHPVIFMASLLHSGESQELGMEWTVADAWGGPGAGSYHLTFKNQPTIQPTALEVVVHPPPGLRIAEAAEGVNLEGRVATWSDTPTDLVTIDLTFFRPLADRAWRLALGIRPLAGT